MNRGVRGFTCEFQHESSIKSFFQSIAELYQGKKFVNSVESFVSIDNRITRLPSSFDSDYFFKMADSNFWAERFVLHIYSAKMPQEDLHTYTDYLNSTCEAIILLYDVCFLEVYMKDPDLLNILLKNAKNLDDGSVTEKTDEDDPRLGMYV